MFYQEINGNLIKLALQGEFDVIAHGCNCFCTMKSGIAPQMAKAFKCDNFRFENKEYQGNINKLGTIDYTKFYQEKIEYGGKWIVYPDEKEFLTGKSLSVINAYTQYKYGKNHLDGVENPLDYEALTLCLRKINHQFKGKHIGLPQIGCGLAGGIWDVSSLSEEDYQEYLKYPTDYKFVKDIIKKELKDCKVTIVIYNK